MKKTRRILSIILCICMIFPSAFTALAENIPAETYSSPAEYVEKTTEHIETEEEKLQSLKRQARGFNRISNFVVNNILGNFLKLIIRDSPDVQRYKDFSLDSYEGFMPGMDKFINEPLPGARWHLGYGSASVLPPDIASGKYMKGAYAPNIYGNAMYKDDEGRAEDLRARAVIMNDGSARGSVLFIVLDVIGLGNGDVRRIRQCLSKFAEENNIVSINISATHTHTGIDSQGIWNDPVALAFRNGWSGKSTPGIEPDFIRSFTQGAVKAAYAAAADMKSGELYYTSYNAGRYFTDRAYPLVNDPNIYKLEFRPDDKSSKPTIIASFGCHPEIASYDWNEMKNGKDKFDRSFSPDFIWTMEKVINSAGYNFIYIQGNVSVAGSSRGYSDDNFDLTAHGEAMRFGYELGYIILSTGMNRNERIALNEKTGDRLGIKQYGSLPGFTPWYNGLYTVKAQKVSPFINAAHEAVIMPVENNLMALVAKTGLTTNKVIKKSFGRYYCVTEIGYLQIGDAFRAMLSPGETYSELRYGGEGMNGSSVKSISETLGPDVIVFDLMNDAIGYLANEAEYVIAGVEYDERKKEFDDNTWCIFSYGRHAGTKVLTEFYALAEKVK